MRHAAASLTKAVFLAATLGGINRLIYRHNDVGDRDFGCLAGQGVSAAGATGRFDQLMATQLAEQLFQVRQRNLLTLADGRQSDGAIILAQGQVNHCCDRKAAFGREAHFQAP